jgi:hypothetical protein
LDRDLARSELSEHRLRYCASLELPDTFRTKMDPPMAGTTKGNKIFFHVASQLAARLNVMDLEIFGASALLASPAITLKYPLAKLSISIPL